MYTVFVLSDVKLDVRDDGKLHHKNDKWLINVCIFKTSHGDVKVGNSYILFRLFLSVKCMTASLDRANIGVYTEGSSFH